MYVSQDLSDHEELDSGVMFCTYSLLVSAKGSARRIDQLVKVGGNCCLASLRTPCPTISVVCTFSGVEAMIFMAFLRWMRFTVPST